MWKWLANYWLDPEFNRKRQFLKQVPFFRNVPRKEFGRLFQALAERNYQAGDVLFKEGDVGRALFILEWGQVEITRQTGMKRQSIAVLGPGDYFGEVSLMDDQPRTASATALTPSRVYLLYKTELESLLEGAPHAAAAIMAHLAEVLAARLRYTMNRIHPTSPDPETLIKKAS
jgi:CRP/FNR family transcriptional regulator, cyclic AMP receptor protein